MGVGFQHGPGYYHMDPQGRTYDKSGHWVFRDSEEQTVEESSDKQEQGGTARKFPWQSYGDEDGQEKEMEKVENWRVKRSRKGMKGRQRIQRLSGWWRLTER